MSDAPSAEEGRIAWLMASFDRPCADDGARRAWLDAGLATLPPDHPWIADL